MSTPIKKDPRRKRLVKALTDRRFDAHPYQTADQLIKQERAGDTLAAETIDRLLGPEPGDPDYVSTTKLPEP